MRRRPGAICAKDASTLIIELVSWDEFDEIDTTVPLRAIRSAFPAHGSLTTPERSSPLTIFCARSSEILYRHGNKLLASASYSAFPSGERLQTSSYTSPPPPVLSRELGIRRLTRVFGIWLGTIWCRTADMFWPTKGPLNAHAEHLNSSLHFSARR
jgi:hypothetical protein